MNFLQMRKLRNYNCLRFIMNKSKGDLDDSMVDENSRERQAFHFWEREGKLLGSIFQRKRDYMIE